MAISTNGTVLARVAGALYNTQMSNATYSEVKTLDPATLVDALYARDFANATDAAVATTLVTNLGMTSVAGLVNWVAAQLTAAGSHKGAKIVDLLNGFAQMSADATYGAYATAFNAKVDVALTLSQTTGNTGGTFAAAGSPVNATFSLTAGVDEVLGTSGNDTIKGTLSGTSNADGTFKAIDIVNGGAGTDTFEIVDATGGLSLPSLLNVSNVEVLSLRSAAALTADASTVAFETVKSTQSAAATVTANAASNVEISGASDAIIANGGKNITVIDATAAKAITVGGTTAPKGTVTITDTKLSTALITVDGGTDVSVTASGVTIAAADNFDSDSNNSADLKAAIVVGYTTAASGTAAVSSTGAAITSSSGSATLGAIEARAKGNITVSQSATSDATAAASDTTSVATITQGAIKVVTGANGTSVTIVQSPSATANDAVTAVAAVSTTQKVTFSAAASGDVITATFDTNKALVFKAAKALTATEVASAFANLAKNAVLGSSPATNGVYSNGSSTNDTGWTSGAVTTSEDSETASVTFSNASTTATITSVATSGAGTAPVLATAVAGTAAVLAETGKLGVVAGAVTVDGNITDADVLSTVTLDSYGTSTVKSDALTTLNLSNSDAGLTVTTASTGSVTLNLNKVAGSSAAVSLDGGSTATVTDVIINTTVAASDLAVTAAAAKTVTINATVAADLTASAFDAATKIVVTGAGKVTLDGDASSSVLAAVDASGATGTVNASGVALTAAGVYTGGSGADTFTVTASATKASTGGAGDDVISVSTFGTGGSVDAGTGTDTLVITAENAATASSSSANALAFNTAATNFEKLSLKALGTDTGNVNTTVAVDLSKLVYSSVVSAGSTDSVSNDIDTLSLTNAASGITLEVTAAGKFSIAVKDAATSTTDVVNLVTNIDGNLAVGTVTVANVETINISATDKVVDTSGSYDAFGSAAADGVDDTNSVQSITLAADSAATVNVTGSADMTVDLTSSTMVTAVNASSFTGKFTLVADGKSTGTTVTGGAGADTLTADGSNDVLVGGSGADTLAADSLTTLTGGSGNDTFVMPAAVNATVYSTITDLTAGDVIKLNNGIGSFTTTKLSLSANSTFQQYLDAAVAANVVTGNTAEAVVWFQFNGDTFIVVDGYDSTADATGYTAAEDSVIAITGLVNLATVVFNSTADTLTIA